MRAYANPSLFPRSLFALFGGCPSRPSPEPGPRSPRFMNDHLLRDVGLRREISGFDREELVRF